MKELLTAALKTAMKQKNRVKLNTIRGLLSALQYEEIQKKTDNLPEQSIIAIIKNEVKKRKEAIEYADRADRADQKATLLEELSYLEEFLPQQLSAEELEKIVINLKEQDSSINFGQVMKSLKEAYFGQYDGKLASDVVKKVLQ